MKCSAIDHRKQAFRNHLALLFWLLLSCFLLGSCTLRTIKNLNPVALQETFFENTYFSNPEKDYVYKAKIEAFGNHFGGILAIKKLKKQHHRVAFTTEFGAKIFDFELENAAFKVNYIIVDLNKKIILKNLQKNFRLLLTSPISADKKYIAAAHTVYRSRFNKRYHFYFFSNQNGLLDKLIQTSKTKEKLVVLFEPKEAQSAHYIKMVHQRFPLKIELKSF